MFHERAALVGRGSRVAQSLARHALRTNDTLPHRITCSVGNPLSSFGSLALPKKLLRSRLLLSLKIDESLQGVGGGVGDGP